MRIYLLILFISLFAHTPSRSRVILHYNNKYDEEILTFIRVINSEAYGQSYVEKLRVGSVILNRLNSGLFPSTLDSVILQKNQFKGVGSRLYIIDNTTPKGRESINAGVWLFDHGSILPKNVLFFHNPKTGKDRKWINKMKHKLYLKGDQHWYFKV